MIGPVKRARRLENLPVYPFAGWVEEVNGVLQQGVDVIRLDIGNPDLPPPASVAEVYSFPLCAELGFLPDLEAIPPRIARRATLMWLNFPNNPTGATVDLQFLERAVAYAQQYDLLVCYDAAYCDICYGEYVAPSLLQVPGAEQVGLEFNSLSKTWNLAGWRVGMALGHPTVLETLAQVKSNVDSGMFRAVQIAAVQALSIDPSWLSRRNSVYQARLSTLLDGLARLGIASNRPRAAIYVWARTPAGWASEAYARALLHSAGVAVAPGSFFGAGGEGYIRFSLTASQARIEEAIRRLDRLG